MNKYLVHINVMPLKNLLDPQGKAVESGLNNLGLQQISNVRIGKHIQLHIEAASAEAAEAIANDACKQLLANAVMEQFEIDKTEAVAN